MLTTMGKRRMATLAAGKWTDAKFTVREGQKYSFQAMDFDNPGAGGPAVAARSTSVPAWTAR